MDGSGTFSQQFRILPALFVSYETNMPLEIILKEAAQKGNENIVRSGNLSHVSSPERLGQAMITLNSPQINTDIFG